jgi:hypothetical protein
LQDQLLVGGGLGGPGGLGGLPDPAGEELMCTLTGAGEHAGSVAGSSTQRQSVGKARASDPCMR